MAAATPTHEEILKDWKAAVEKHGRDAVLEVVNAKRAALSKEHAKVGQWTSDDYARGYQSDETRAKIAPIMKESKIWEDLLNEIDPQEDPMDKECVQRVLAYGRAYACGYPYCDCVN